MNDDSGTGVRHAVIARRKKRISIAVLLAATLSGLVILTVASVIAINFTIGRSNTLDLLRDRGELASHAIEAEVRGQLDPAMRQLEFLVDRLAAPDFPIDDKQRVTDLLVGALSGTPQITRLVFASAKRRVTIADQTDDRLNFEVIEQSDNPLMRQSLANAAAHTEGWWGDLILDPRGGRVALLSRRHSVWRGGELLGEISGQINVRALSGGLPTVTTGDAVGRSFILYDRDRVLAHARLLQPMQGLTAQHPLPGIGEVDDPALAAIWNPAASMPLLGTGSDFHIVEVDGVRHLYLYRQLEGYAARPLLVGAWFRAEDVFDELRRLLFATGAGYVILLFATLAAVFIGQRLARPIRRLARAAAHVRRFEFSRIDSLPGSRVRELDEQARAFNDMLVGLRWFEAYVPRPLVRHLLRHGSGRRFPSVEREATVMFTDIVGFTSLAEHRQAGDIAALLNSHFAMVTRAIEDHDGTIDKFIGDGAMAFWNAPHRHGDHARRAAQAALDIAAAISADNRARVERGLAPIRVRIGIHTGPVVVGNIGPPNRLNYTIVGDTVNTAQRIEELCRDMPDVEDVVILIGDRTAAELGGEFDCRPAGRFNVRGRAELVEVFRLRAKSPAAAPAPAARAAGSSVP